MKNYFIFFFLTVRKKSFLCDRCIICILILRYYTTAFYLRNQNDVRNRNVSKSNVIPHEIYPPPFRQHDFAVSLHLCFLNVFMRSSRTIYCNVFSFPRLVAAASGEEHEVPFHYIAGHERPGDPVGEPRNKMFRRGRTDIRNLQ